MDQRCDQYSIWFAVTCRIFSSVYYMLGVFSSGATLCCFVKTVTWPIFMFGLSLAYTIQKEVDEGQAPKESQSPDL